MLARSLIIFICIGVLAGFVFGFYLHDIKNINQLVYVDGPSISIVTEKSDFKKGEEIKIALVNSGTTPIIFSEPFYSLRITGLFGIMIYSPLGSQVSKLEPGEEIVYFWNQTKNNNDPVLEVLYKINSRGIDSLGNNVEKSVIVNIWK